MGDSETTQNRILEAAIHEFAAHGIAGARVERIAQLASTSKERLYAYFRSKKTLYWHVAENELSRLAQATKLDVADLPEYAGRLFDYYEDHPESYRLIAWGQLEASETGESSAQWKTIVEEKVRKIAGAQEENLIDPTWSAFEILALVSQTAATWALPRDSMGEGQDEWAGRARRRTVVVEAVRRLVTAPGSLTVPGSTS
jgi:AcrR family transcriptional regulator